MRVTASFNVQLVTFSVIIDLFGNSTSRLSKSVTVVARILILLTVPLKLPMVTKSPTRIGRSNNMIKPETKFATISCKPKPRPTPSAAMIHCNLDQSMPS